LIPAKFFRIPSVLSLKFIVVVVVGRNFMAFVQSSQRALMVRHSVHQSVLIA
jgi:hypothetical protein